MAFEQASDEEQALDSIPMKEQAEELVDLVTHPKKRPCGKWTQTLADYQAGRTPFGRSLVRLLFATRNVVLTIRPE